MMSALMSAPQKLSTRLNVLVVNLAMVPLESGGTRAREGVWTESPPCMADPSAEAKPSFLCNDLTSNRSRLTKLILAPVSTRTQRVRAAPSGAVIRRSRASWRLSPARLT